MRFLIVLLSLALCACSTGTTVTRTYVNAQGKPVTEVASGNAATYGLYVDAQVRLATAAPAASDGAQQCPPADGSCITAAHAFAALAAGSRGQISLQPPPRERDWAEKARDFFLGAANITTPLVGAWQANHASDNLVEITRSNNDTQRALYSDAFGVAGAAVTNAGARITVGGNLGDTQSIGGDSIAGDGNAAGGSQIGDTYGDDYTGRDRVENDGVINSGDGNRFESPGPIDNSNDGDECTGTLCQGPGGVP